MNIGKWSFYKWIYEILTKWNKIFSKNELEIDSVYQFLKNDYLSKIDGQNLKEKILSFNNMNENEYIKFVKEKSSERIVHSSVFLAYLLNEIYENYDDNERYGLFFFGFFIIFFIWIILKLKKNKFSNIKINKNSKILNK